MSPSERLTGEVKLKVLSWFGVISPDDPSEHLLQQERREEKRVRTVPHTPAGPADEAEENQLIRERKG